VTDPTDSPAPTGWSIPRWRAALREFAATAREAGNSPKAVAAVKELDRRLHVPPQFGEPIIDLTHEPGQVCIGTVPPLMVRYAIDEDRRLVIVTILRILPESDA
jgi:hypothetical protein